MGFLKKILVFLYLKIRMKSRLKVSFSAMVSKNSFFEGMNKIYPYAFFDGYLGFGSYIGPNSRISGKIGRYTSIAPNVVVNNGIHPYRPPFVSTSPVFVSLRKQAGATFTNIQRFDELRFIDRSKRFSVLIGNDCWIGERVFIAGGVRLGDGAVVLAGSVIVKDVAPFSIVGGVPAKLIDFRYDPETIELLMKVCWWNKSAEWLKENVDLMCDISKFKKYFLQNEA
jgi:acetyltransferase-like isoleucine patch superfamily enzyme